MTQASTTAAAATLPRPPQWGIGRYDVADEPVYFEVSWDDWRRDTAWSGAMLAGHGLGPGGGLVVVGGMAESPWFDPFETAARELGAPYSIGEIYAFEAFRTGMYARRLPVTMIFGIDRTVAEGLGDELAEVVARVPVIMARPDAAALLAGAGAAPFTVTRLGPAIAVECPQRRGAHVNSAEWTVAERGGDLLISTAGPRAHQVSQAATGLRGRLTEGRCGCGRTGQRVFITQCSLFREREPMAPRHITLGDIIAEHGRSYPGKLALADGDRELTWPEFDERVSRLANALRVTGVGPGDRILWLGQNSFRVYELLGAAARIGAMLCPGYWRWAPPEMAFAIEDFSPKVVIWQEEEIGSTVRTARALAGPVAEAALWLRHDGDPRHGYEEFLAGGDPADPGLDIDPDSALLVIYTAAISGRPGGSMLSHANLIAMGMAVAWLGDVDDSTVFLNSGPMFHIGNFQFYGIPVLTQGGTNVVTRRVVAAEVLDILAARKCTRAYLMPATITQLTALMRERGTELPQLKATIAPPLWQGLVAADDSRHGREGGGMGYGYGQTEVTGFCLYGGYGGRGAGNAGRPAPVTSVRILDSGGRECAVGQAGEICVRGATVHLGYWNRPEINARRFRGGWWHTTDLGRREPDGTITFLGTMTRMIKSGAENVFPAEVENCLEAHPAVREAAVIGIPSERFLQDVKAVIVLNDGAAASAGDLIEHCRRRIASYKKPKTVEFLDALPRTPDRAKDYATLDAKFGGGGYPGGDNLGGGHPNPVTPRGR